MKFPFFKSLGTEDGSYRVGPLSRVTMCDHIPTPLADKERENSSHSTAAAPPARPWATTGHA
jgi:coenzyme F420-reducing hydrogenase alpha subunit